MSFIAKIDGILEKYQTLAQQLNDPVALGNDFPKINFKRGSLVKYFPKKSDKPNKILIIVGFK